MTGAPVDITLADQHAQLKEYAERHGKKRPRLEPSFRCRVALDLDMDLAMELGTLILSTRTDNTALLALGHELTGE